MLEEGFEEGEFYVLLLLLDEIAQILQKSFLPLHSIQQLYHVIGDRFYIILYLPHRSVSSRMLSNRPINSYCVDWLRYLKMYRRCRTTCSAI